MFHIGFLTPVTGGFFFGDVLLGVNRTVTAAGGRVTVVQTIDAGWAARAFAATPNSSLPSGWATLDGFVTISWAASPDQVSALRAAGKPVVIVSSDLVADAATVVVDNRTCVREAVAHLKDHGHRHIAFVGSLDQSDIRERQDACRDAAAEHGLAFTFIPTIDQIESGGTGATPTVADARRDGVTAIVAGTDRVALGLMQGLASLGLKAPNDLAIIGFDDVEGGWSSSPPLATVRQDFDAEGALAANLVLSELSGVEVPHVRHLAPATFIPRDSCGCHTVGHAQSPGATLGGVAVADLILGQIAVGESAERRRIGVADIDCEGLDNAICDAVGPITAGHSPPRTVDASPRRASSG